MKNKEYQFNEKYYEKYLIKNLIGKKRGEKDFLYSYWIRWIKKRYPVGSRVLDAGCGVGFFLKRLVENHFNAIGCDISESAIKLASEKNKVLVYQCSIEKLPFESSSFDIIFAFDVIEHLKSPELFFKEARRTLKLGGVLILSTPNPDSLGAKIKKKPKLGEQIIYEKRYDIWHGWRDSSHINIRPIQDWHNMIIFAGFDIIREGTDGLWDVPYLGLIPNKIQKIIFNSINFIQTYLLGFLKWKVGENYICISRKK